MENKTANEKKDAPKQQSARVRTAKEQKRLDEAFENVKRRFGNALKKLAV